MTGTDLLVDLRRRGYRVTLREGQVMVGPAATLSERDREKIASHREGLLAALRQEQAPAPPAADRLKAAGWSTLRVKCSGEDSWVRGGHICSAELALAILAAEEALRAAGWASCRLEGDGKAAPWSWVDHPDGTHWRRGPDVHTRDVALGLHQAEGDVARLGELVAWYCGWKGRPAAPFQLRPAEAVADPARFFAALDADLGGKEALENRDRSPRDRKALARDLAALQRLFGGQ
jgi:hypothetical protein